MEVGSHIGAAGPAPDISQTPDRYFESRRLKKQSKRPRTLNHRVRIAAKRYVEQHPGEAPCRTHALEGVHCHLVHGQYGEYTPRLSEMPRTVRFEKDRQELARLRHHAEHDIRGNFQELRHHFTQPRRTNGSHRPYIWSTPEIEDIELARSRDPLPSDRHRTLQRTPSLEREEAFCDATTTKGKILVKPMTQIEPQGDDAQVADLYRMGLLYDEEEKLQNFGLNDIRHSGPLYSIRPARRGRKTYPHKSKDYNGSLPLDLSFADLGADIDLAQFYPGEDGAAAANDDSLQHTSRRGSSATSNSNQHQRKASAPLRVIYELATSRPSFDVDTSQPPDLMSDSLSDYDYFSDSDLDDGAGQIPSQREVHDGATATAASGPWVLLGDDS